MQLSISDDFSLKKIANSGQCFRVKEFDDGTFRFITGNEVLYIKEISSHLFEISCSEKKWGKIWTPYFDLGRNYRRICNAIPVSDTYMRQAAHEGRGIRILKQDPWEILITFIISQRKSIPAIKNSVELLSSKYGDIIITPYEKLNAFPTVQQLADASDKDLSNCKLGYRVSYVKDAVAQVESGNVDLSDISFLSDSDLLNTLKTIRGVGNKVANCICLFAYGRINLAPIDTWILKVISCEYNGKNPFPSYGQDAGIMQQYAFYYAQTNKKMFRNEENNYS